MDLCLSVRLSVRHKSVFYRNGWTNRTGFWHVSFLPSVLHCVKGNSVISKNKGTPLWNFVLNSGLRKFRHGISIVETCYVYQLIAEKGGRSERDKLGRRQSTKSILPPSSDARPLYPPSHRSSSAVYSTILSHGSISDSWYLVHDLSYKLFLLSALLRGNWQDFNWHDAICSNCPDHLHK